MLKKTPLDYFIDGEERMNTVASAIYDLSKEIWKPDFSEGGLKNNDEKRNKLKEQIINLVELLFPTIISALEQYYKNMLIEKLNNKKFIKTYVIDKNKFVSILNVLQIKEKVTDYILNHGCDRQDITLGMFVENNRKVNFQDFQNQVKKIYKTIFNININDKRYFKLIDWQDILRIKKCRDIVIHDNGIISRENLESLNLIDKEEYIGKSVAELYIDWNNRNILNSFNKVLRGVDNYISLIDRNLYELYNYD